jgi:hypothetical protein
MSPEIAEAEAPVTDIHEFPEKAFLVYETRYDTVGTSNPSFEKIKDLCSDRPLALPARPPLTEDLTAENEEDIKNALDSLKEQGSTRLEDLEKELGL